MGANIGFFSMLAATLVGPSGRVVSIEPGAGALALLAASAARNGFRQIEIWPVATAETRQVVGLAGLSSHGTLVERDAVTPGSRMGSIVVALPIDELLAEEPRVDVIKLDVEGAEGRALRGARRTLEKHRPILVLEFSPPALANVSKITGEALIELLRDAGYEVALLGEDGLATEWSTGLTSTLRELATHAAFRGDLIARPR